MPQGPLTIAGVAHRRPARYCLRHHWPEYLMEAAGLGSFMLLAILACAVLEHPDSPLPRAIPNAFERRAILGVVIGLVAAAIIYSPWGKQSGAHINPAVTLAWLRLGKVHPWDAFFYVCAQTVGGTLGVLLAAVSLHGRIAHPSVGWLVTVPGPWGVGAAFGAEAGLSFLLMSVVLAVSSRPAIARWTGVVAACLVAVFIALEAPVSGMSINPARTLASAVPSGVTTSLWIYLVAPPLGMLLAAEATRAMRGAAHCACAKLHHHNRSRCIHCGKEEDVHV